MNGEGTRPLMTCEVSYVFPSPSKMFQFGHVFSEASTSVPPAFVGPLLQVFGFASHSAKPGEDCCWFVPPPPLLVPQAPRISTDAAAIATRPPSLFDRVRIFPPVGYCSRSMARCGQRTRPTEPGCVVVPKGNDARRRLQRACPDSGLSRYADALAQLRA